MASSSRSTFSLVIPFHKDVHKLATTLARIQEEGPANGVIETLLCHNGIALSKEQVASVEKMTNSTVHYFHTDRKGIGAGYRLGIEQSRAEYVILSASDLPFGWTDLESFKRVSDCVFAIGSKAHKESKVGNITLKRRLASFAFLSLRRFLLGADTPGDSQGSLIIKTDLARELLKSCNYDNYLFSLEIASYHLKSQGKVEELPVVLENNEGTSSVSILRDGWQMFLDLWELKRRLKIFARKKTSL